MHTDAPALHHKVRQRLRHGLLAVQVVCEEEADPYRWGSKGQRKQRFVGGIVTPASPMYMYGLVVDDGNMLDPTEIARPLLGVARTKAGYSVCGHVILLSCTSSTAGACCTWTGGR